MRPIARFGLRAQPASKDAGARRRLRCLGEVRRRVAAVFDEPPQELPRLADFADFGHDSQQRFMVVVRRSEPAAERSGPLSAELLRVLQDWHRRGILQSTHSAGDGDDPWRAF